MKIEEIKTYKYITNDGKEFIDKNKAEKHEEKLMRYKLDDKSFELGKYQIYKINNYDELNALIFSLEYSEIIDFMPDKCNSFPFYLCYERLEEHCYSFRLLDDVINSYENIINELKKVKEDD